MGIDACIWAIPSESINIDKLNERFWLCYEPFEYFQDETEPMFYIDSTGDVRARIPGNGRHYSDSYERGSALQLFTIVEWLRYALPQGSKVFYAGDTWAADEDRPWKEKDTMRVLRHFWKYGHHPYRRDTPLPEVKGRPHSKRPNVIQKG